MTPLEIAAKAYWEKRQEPKPFPWEQQTAAFRQREVEQIRAALLALANMDLPDSVVQAGADAIERASHYGGASDEYEAKVAFDAMCRAIARDRP